jgi:hypothetical protein
VETWLEAGEDVPESRPVSNMRLSISIEDGAEIGNEAIISFEVIFGPSKKRIYFGTRLRPLNEGLLQLSVNFDTLKVANIHLVTLRNYAAHMINVMNIEVWRKKIISTN